MYTALHRYAASVAECAGELCTAATCSARTSARILASVFSRGSDVPPLYSSSIVLYDEIARSA